MNGNADSVLASEDTSVNIFSNVPSTSEGDISIEKHVSLLKTQDKNVYVQKRKSWTFSRTASLSTATTALNRRSSSDFNPCLPTKPPPLIPAPKSFLHRKFSLSATKQKDELHPLQRPAPTLHPPLAPPLPVHINNNTEVEDTIVLDSQVTQPSFLEPANDKHTTQYSQTSPVIPSSTPSTAPLHSHPPSSQTSPPSFSRPHFRFPPPPNSPRPPHSPVPPPNSPPPPHSPVPPPNSPPLPHSPVPPPNSPPPPHSPIPPPHSPPTLHAPPAPSPTLFGESPFSDNSTPATSATLLSSHAVKDTASKQSVLTSEISDPSNSDSSFPASSFHNSLDRPDASSSFHFNSVSKEHSQVFTLNSPSAPETEGSVNTSEAHVFATHNYNVSSLQHLETATLTSPQIGTNNNSKNAGSLKPVKSSEEAVGKTWHDYNQDIEASVVNDVATNEPKLPDIPKEPMTRKHSLSPKKVVEVLKLQPDKTVRQQIKPGLVGELANLFQNMGDEQDISTWSGVSHLSTEHTVASYEDRYASSRQQSLQTTVSSSSQMPDTDLSHGKEDENIGTFNTSVSRRRSSNNVEMIQSATSLHPVEDWKNQPGVNYLTASREILKRFTEDRSQAEANTLKKDSFKRETHYFGGEDNIVFPSVLDSSNPNKIKPKITADTKDGTSSIGTNATGADQKFRGVTADLDNLRGETLAKSASSDSHVFLSQADLSAVTSSRDAVQEDEHVFPAGGPVKVSTGVPDLNREGQEMPASINDSFLPTVREMSIDHDQSVSRVERRGNTKQHEDVYVTDSQFATVTAEENSHRTDELKPITDNYQRNVAVINPYRTHPLSHVISSTEPILTTPPIDNVNSLITINKGQAFTSGGNYNTLGETPMAKTGSENRIQTNQSSLPSKLSLSTQTFSNSQSNSDYRARGFDNITSFTSRESPMVGPTVDTSSNLGVVLTDDGPNLDFSSSSRHGYKYLSNENDDVINREDTADSINLENDENREDKANYRGNKEKVASSLDVDLTPTTSRTEDYFHKQTVVESFRPPVSSDRTFVSGSSVHEFTSTAGVDVSSKRFTDQVSGEDHVKFPTYVTKSQESYGNSDAVESNSIERLNTDSSVAQQSDDFMSILEDITIQTDITSAFIRSCRPSDIYSEGQCEDSERGGNLIDEQVMKARENGILNESSPTYNSSVQGFDEAVRGITQEEDMEFDHSLPATTEITAFLSARDHADLNEEVEKQHDVLSPKLNEPTEYKTMFRPGDDDTRSHRSSVSSTAGSQKGLNPNTSKETMFNSDFFSSSETINGKSLQTSLQVGSLMKPTVSRHSHADPFQNSLNSHKTVGNLNEHEDMSKSEWISPVDISRLIPWSEYEEKSQIPFVAASDDSLKELGNTSYRSSITITSDDEREQKTPKHAAVNKDVLKKEQITNNMVERRLSKQEPLITASKIVRSIAWTEYEDKLKGDSQPLDHQEYNKNEIVHVESVKSNNSVVEHSQHNLFQQELTQTISPRLLSHTSAESVNGNLTQGGKEIYQETRQQYDIQYSQDARESGFNVGTDSHSDQTNDSNNNTLTTYVRQTTESSTVTEFTPHLPEVVSNENGDTTKQQLQDEIQVSKSKFQNLKSVFEQQDFENHPKPTIGFVAKRNSFKFNTHHSPPTRGVSRAKYDKNEGMSNEVGGRVTSQHETGVYVSRDSDQSGVDVHVIREKGTEIDTAERRDSQSTDTSDEPADRALVDTRGTRAAIKKSQQTSLAEDVQTGKLQRESFSRNSSVRSSSSSRSVKSVEYLSSYNKPVSGHFSVDGEGIGQPQTDNWPESVYNVGLDKNIDLPRVSDTSTTTDNWRKHDNFQITADNYESTSTQPDKQTDLIDAFLRSSIGTKDLGHQEPLNAAHEIGKPTGYTGINRGIVAGNSFGYTKDIDGGREQDGGAISFGRGTESVNAKTDQDLKEVFGHSEPNNLHSTNGQGEHEDNMSAVVGEISSFSIHKKITREESLGVHSETSTVVDSSRDNKTTHQNQSVAPEMYLIADKNGDYYALQEVDDVADGNSVLADSVNLHVVEMARTYGPGRARNDPNSINHDHNPRDRDVTDVYIDSSAVDDDKARELISAYLDSQELNRQQHKTASDLQTHQGSSTTQQVYSRNYNEDLTPRGAGAADTYRGNSYTDNSGVHGTSEFISSTHTGSIVVQQNGHNGVTGSATHSDHASSRGYIKSSTHPHDDRANHFADNNFMSNSSRFEQLNASSGDQGSFTSAYNMTRLSGPHGQDPSSESSYVTRKSGDHIINQSDSANHILNHSGVNPFQPTPLTITTTTQAVVGEMVGMRIDYPPNGASDAFPSSSDEESNKRRYIVKNVQQKSSLKKSSNYDPRSVSDSNSEDVFTLGGIRAAQYSTIGTTRDFVQSNNFDTRQARSINGSDSMSPRSVADESVYRVYQSPNHSLPRSANDYNRSYNQENSFVSSREDDLYKVRNLSTSVPDGLQYAGEHRGRPDKRSPNYGNVKKASKGVRKYHSPERIFKNAKLSLRKDDYDNDYYSDEETGNTQYRTVTKVYLNENKPRSRSQSPDARYKVSSVQNSYERKQDLDETDSGYQEHNRRYIVVGTSDNSEDRHVVNAHSSPRLDRKLTKSFEEATITRTESVQPSRLSNEPPSTKTHKTVIQLEADEETARERRRSNDADPQYMTKRAQSVDDLHGESRSVLTVSSQDQSLWRTGKVLSRSNSEDDDVDRRQASTYATSPRLVKTLKQEDGDRLYVVNSTVPREPDGSSNHPDGWYKSTIDINQNRPDKSQSVDDLFSHRIHEDRFDSHNFRTEKSVYFVREAAPHTNSSRNVRGHHSTEFAYPDSGTGTEVTSSDGENEVRQRFERVERIYEVRSQPDLPEQFHSMEDLSNDLRVLRGNILIKNRLNETDHGGDDFDENVNLFDNSFHLGKDNPLFSSDPDIRASLQREEEQALASHVHQDITFETVDKIAHEFRQERQVQTKPPAARKKQNLSQLLLSKLANVDSKDIRQTIDVEHHNEEIYGDIDFIHADGERKTSSDTRNFDSVNEKVELTLTQGKAYVIIKVIAERIVPTDYEFNVWRKSQAIVTRQIEIDLLANEQRRRLYKHVMASAGTAGSLEDGSRSHYYDSQALSAQERQLSSMETLKLFSQILDVTEGQGDKDYTETHTRQEMGQLPAAGMDLLY